MPRDSSVGKELSFRAELESWAEGMDYCAVYVPARITRALKTKAAVLVMARVNDSKPFKVSLFPIGDGQHCIRIKAKVRKETETGVGDRVRIRFVVLDRADVKIPKDLAVALRARCAPRELERLPPGKRNFLVRRIEEAAKPETRAKRIEELVLEVLRSRRG